MPRLAKQVECVVDHSNSYCCHAVIIHDSHHFCCCNSSYINNTLHVSQQNMQHNLPWPNMLTCRALEGVV